MAEALPRFDAKAQREIVDLVSRLDSRGWRNAVTGFGTDRDKTSFTHYGHYNLLSLQQLAALYHGDDVAARAVDTIPDEMLRESFSVDLEDQKLTEAATELLDELDVRGKLADGIRWGRLFGGSALIVGADDGRPASMPLIAEQAETVRYLYVVDRRFLYPLTWYRDAGNPKLGQAETYLVVPSSGFTVADGLVQIHESRLITFGGAKTAPLERFTNFGWDHSILQNVYEVLASFATGFKAVEVMLTDGNQSVFKMQGLAQLLAAGGAEALQARIAAIDLYRSAVRAIVVDAGDTGPEGGAGAESFERQGVSFEQIPAVLDKFMLRLSAALRIPVTILMGQSPAGMNATGDSDFRWFYDRIRSQQTIDLAPKIRRLLRIILATKAFGRSKTQPKIEINFPQLWTETASVQATRRASLATGDAAYINAGVLTPEEVALARFRSGGFDQEIELSDEGREARETALTAEFDDMENPETPPTGTLPVVPPADDAADDEGGPESDDALVDDTRTDAADYLLGAIGQHERVVIVGGPRTGKSTLAARAGERFSRAVRGTDSLIGQYGKDQAAWGKASAEASTWLDEPGSWVVEGVAGPRAIRKWLRANPGKKPPFAVVRMGRPKVERSKGQAAMAKGVHRVWLEVMPILRELGATIIDEDPS